METPVKRTVRWLAALAVLILAIPTLGGGHTYAQGSRTFPETGKTVQGQFLDYWNQNGGLSQQGYPISNEIQERSDTDGKTYTVQYFERAVFELHPELTTANKVLLSLLGNFLYKQKYPSGAPGQQANSAPGSVFYSETGHRLGGKFQAYWQTHGGLTQQGFPISDEFQEQSSLDGKTYVVQYFERAVFEYHPENAGTAYEILLSQLGKFRYDQKYAGGGNPPQGGGNPPQGGGNPPSGGPQTACGTLPKNVNTATDVSQVRAGQHIRIAAGGFTVGEPVSYWFTAPTQEVIGTAHPVDLEVGSDGIIGPFDITLPSEMASIPGIWALTFQGAFSNNTAIAWFCVTK